jgi:hypothetical protein
MQHTLHRHGTRAILQHASTKLLLSAMVGGLKRSHDIRVGRCKDSWDVTV